MKLQNIAKPALLLMILLSSIQSHAQYLGGDGSGNSLTDLTQSNCSATILPDIFKGGNEDGFTSVAVVQSLCSPIVLPGIFIGGSEDGHSMADLNQANCNPIIYPNIFTGGNEDGYSFVGITQSSCLPHIYADIFKGGVEDGYASFGLTQSACSPPVYDNMYVGGSDDGHAMIAMFTACAPYADFVADATVICEGDTVNFTDLSLGTPLSWNWTFSGGTPANASIQNPSVVYNTSGTYSVTLFITSGTGNSTITKTNYITVNALPVPVITVSGAPIFCEGDSLLISCTPSMPVYNSHSWSNGATSQNIYALTSDTYTVTVSDVNGCEGISNPIVVTVLSNPIPSIFTTGPSPLCVGDSMTLTSSPANSYLWSPGGEVSQQIQVLSSGTFWVTATYSNGCSRGSNPESISFGNTPAKPVITPSGPIVFCDGGSVTLISSPAPGYLWTPDSQITQSINVTSSGTFYVEAVGGSGCSSVSDPVTVTVLTQTPTPIISANGPVTFCDGDSVTLTSTAATSYLWAPGGQTSQSITVSSSGNYSVQTDNGTGCSANSLPVTVTVLTQTPTPIISANGPVTFCDGDSVTLTSTVATSYLWAPGGQTSQSITVSSSGNYSVQTDNGTGCTANSLPVTVTVLAQTPTPIISANGPVTFCDGDSVTLTSTAATSYLWAPGGQTSQSITVSSSGNYSVQTDNGTGCSANSLPVTVTVLAQTPTPIISTNGPVTFCDGDSVTLTSNVATSYLWAPGGQTSQSITVSSGGNYSVQTDNGTGCSANSLPVTVAVLTQTPTPIISANGPVIFCDGDSVTLTSTVATSYLWAPGGQTSQSITVSSGGNYSVQTDNGTGCTANSLPVTVTVLTQTPTPIISANGPVIFCDGDSVTLTSTVATSYLWAPGGQTSQSITVSSSGNYSVQTDNGTGCSANSLPVTVTVLTQTPTPIISANGPVTFCDGDSVTLTSTAATSYLWAPGGQTSQSITVSSGGNYSVQTDNGTGCSANSLPVTVTVLTQTPTPIISANGPVTFCDGDSVTLTSTVATSYLWAPGGQTSQSIIVSSSGNYSVQTDNGTGCSANSLPVTVTVYSFPLVPVIQASGPLTFCNGDSVILTSDPFTSYYWYPNGDTTQQITVHTSGTFYVETSNGNCSSVSLPVNVNVLAVPSIPIITINGSAEICDGDSVSLSAPPSSSYIWYPGSQNTQEIWVNSTGTYWVEVFNLSGCSSISNPVNIIVHDNPTAYIQGEIIVCQGTEEWYSVNNIPNTEYYWTVNGADVISGLGTNSVQLHFTDTGTVQIEVLIIDQNTSCSATDYLTVTSLNAPEAYAGPDLSICFGDTVQLQAYGGTTYDWIPTLGLDNSAISNPHAFPQQTTLYIVEVANGSCVDNDTVLITVNPLPVANAGSDEFINSGECIVLQGSGGTYYLWSPILGLDNPNISTPEACPDVTTTYILAVTDSAGCSGTDEMTVFVTQTNDSLSYPNTFTPNGDGMNDTWIIDGLEAFPDHKLVIFNRWGNQVFDAQPYLNDWNGDCIGKPLPDGTYYFILDLGDGSDIVKSFITLLR